MSREKQIELQCAATSLLCQFTWLDIRTKFGFNEKQLKAFERLCKAVAASEETDP